MNIQTKNSILVFSLALFFCVIQFILMIVWSKFVLFDRSFSNLWGIIPTLDILAWMPSFIAFGVGGYLTAKIVKYDHIIWPMLMGTIGMVILFLITEISFFEDTTIGDKIWIYVGFMIPLISSTFGGFIYQKVASKT